MRNLLRRCPDDVIIATVTVLLMVLILTVGCAAAGRIAGIENMQADFQTEINAKLADITAAVEANQVQGDKSTAQAGSLNYASAFGTGAVTTVIISIVGFVILNMGAGKSAEKRDQQSHELEMARIEASVEKCRFENGVVVSHSVGDGDQPIGFQATEVTG